MILRKHEQKCFAIIVLNLSTFVGFFFISLYAIYIHWKCVKLKKTKAEILLIEYKFQRVSLSESTKINTKHSLFTYGWNAALSERLCFLYFWQLCFLVSHCFDQPNMWLWLTFTDCRSVINEFINYHCFQIQFTSIGRRREDEIWTQW